MFSLRDALGVWGNVCCGLLLALDAVGCFDGTGGEEWSNGMETKHIQ